MSQTLFKFGHAVPNSEQSKPVMAWQAEVTIPTYSPGEPDKYPVFFEKRVYQGSNGKVYPIAFIDSIADEPQLKTYHGVWLENDCVRLLLLPEIGGRIHLAQDKHNGDFDFFYRQDVIKPALVGLAGPWVSGGVEFNWPQHHRPSTYCPTDVIIEDDEDGGRTVWMGEHDPMNRLKGMVGICLKPGRSNIYAKARVFNRTPFTQTFLWWANVAVEVHDDYQSFFPTDVTCVADHAVRATSSFPLATGHYYGVDYGDNDQGATDISWYKNIPVPTSYMVTKTDFDFFGGFDHKANGGFVHVANRYIAPGKKQWTWGNHEFGHSWDRQLTDKGGPYIELMAGVYTDNQPDFTYLQPYETKHFVQTWWPIQSIGTAVNASDDLALALRAESGSIFMGVVAATAFNQLTILLHHQDKLILSREVDVAPALPFVEKIKLESIYAFENLTLSVVSHSGELLISYSVVDRESVANTIAVATEPPLPADIPTIEELYLTGEHLFQYRHPTRYPEIYWKEALKRDYNDIRCNTGMGELALHRGEFAQAEDYLRTAVKKLTSRHPNPIDGKPHFLLGLTLKLQGRFEDAYAALYKSTWNYAQRSVGYTAIAEIDAINGNWPLMHRHAIHALESHGLNSRASVLAAYALRKLEKFSEAKLLLDKLFERDSLDYFANCEYAALQDAMNNLAEANAAYETFLRSSRSDIQTRLDVCFDYIAIGAYAEARHIMLLNGNPEYPIGHYLLAMVEHCLGNSAEASHWLASGASASTDYCFPSRIDEQRLLEWVVVQRPDDSNAHYYLGNYLYDKKRHNQAIFHWKRAVNLNPSFSLAWRNLGIGLFNIEGEVVASQQAYEEAFKFDSNNGRLLFELDQLAKKAAVPLPERLQRLEKYRHLVNKRDDLAVEIATLYNQTSQPEKAVLVITSRNFHPWEGGEGKVLAQHEECNRRLGYNALKNNHAADALCYFNLALESPRNLGEARHLLAADAHIHYELGQCYFAQGEKIKARQHWARAIATSGDFSSMAVCEYSPIDLYRALSYGALGRREEQLDLLKNLRDFGNKKLSTTAKIDYFATSLPNLLVFEDDIQKRQQAEGYYLIALSYLGEGNINTGKEYLHNVIEIDPAHSGALFHLDIF